MPEPVVTVENVTFGYPPGGLTEPVLEDVSLEIEPCDFLGMIGPNGGGKTTLLKVILGLLRPQQGSVSVFGQSPNQVRDRIGYVPQHAQIDPSVPATVLDVVLTGRLRRSSWGIWYRHDCIEAAHEALRKTRTDDLARRPIGSLSGGQRQRVLIARALAADAQLLLMDEPTAGVDPHAERELIDLLHNLNDRLPIVIVSHDISFVSRHLKRVACLNRYLVCHQASEISSEVVSHMYHHPVMALNHGDDCTLADPGCDHGCDDHEHGASAKEASP
jgi:zinc transport system ATP-binding protein